MQSTATTVSSEQSQEQAVRFSSVNQEIEPAYSLQSVDTLTPDEQHSTGTLSPEAHAEIRNLSRTLQDSHLQHRRMSHFAFEPVSLPVSRVGHKILSSSFEKYYCNTTQFHGTFLYISVFGLPAYCP